MISSGDREILKQAAKNEAAPGRLVAVVESPGLLALANQGYIKRGPYYAGPERDRLVKDIEAGVSEAMPLLGAAGWWLTEMGEREAARKSFSRA